MYNLKIMLCKILSYVREILTMNLFTFMIFYAKVEVEIQDHWRVPLFLNKLHAKDHGITGWKFLCYQEFPMVSPVVYGYSGNRDMIIFPLNLKLQISFHYYYYYCLFATFTLLLLHVVKCIVANIFRAKITLVTAGTIFRKSWLFL